MKNFYFFSAQRIQDNKGGAGYYENSEGGARLSHFFYFIYYIKRNIYNISHNIYIYIYIYIYCAII